MKKTKIIALIAAGSLAGSSIVGTPALATVYKANCINQKGKFTDCKVDVSEKTLTVTYQGKRFKELNRTIEGEKITRLTGGQYARRRVAEAIAGSVLLVGTGAILFPPAALLLFAKKKRDQFGVEYQNPEGKSEALMISIKKKQGLALALDLRKISGRQIAFEDGKKKKKISKKELKRRELMTQALPPLDEKTVEEKQ